MIKTILLIGLLFLTVLFGAKPTTAVDRMQSNSYILKFPNLNMAGGAKESDNYKLLDTLGQTAPGEYSSAGFYVKAGFPYIKTIIPFSFTISNLSIDFGTLTPNTFPDPLPSNTLTVNSGGAGGYQVTAAAAHPLRLQAANISIPDTTCNTDCDETLADLWTNTNKYGFGFNISGDDIPEDFSTPNHYRQFADQSAGEEPQIVMSSVNVGTLKTATVTYKVNISPAQAAGNYQTSITYVATPGY